ncbi:MAG: hypothetical protein HQ509_11070 [Candidatus Marinimicrobia bacterium]|nr:hypothetical protein [Candidatus Neomarinimicrobiota bacterium]
MNDTEIEKFNYTVNDNQILVNGEILDIRGVVYVPGYPGFVPWEIEQSINLPERLKTSIENDINQIKNLGANTIRLWGAPEYCYTAIKDAQDIHILQTLWIDGEQGDLLETVFIENTKEYFRTVIDRIYGVFSDGSAPICGYIVGNEINEASILNTNQYHPEITSFSGNYITTDSSLTASEVFLAQLGDYVKSYVYDNYGDLPLVTYANDIRTDEIIDTPFLDFRSHNAYSYAVAYYLENPPFGSITGTLFQGWIEYLKNKYPSVPLLITETGLSVTPNATHIGPPNYGYGGNTEVEQGNGIIQNFEDIKTAETSVAGVVIHEYLDSWWKFGFEDSFEHDPNDREEWFGIVKIVSNNDWYTTIDRPIVGQLKTFWQQHIIE